MRIIQVTDSLHIGGAEVLAMNLAEGLSKNGCECITCCIGNNGPVGDQLHLKGFKRYSLDRPFGFRLSIMAELAKIFYRENADIVVTHHFRQLIHSLLPALVLRKKIVHIEHDCHFYERDQKSLKRLSFLLKHVVGFITVSEEILNWFMQQIPHVRGKGKAIPNGIDIDRFKRDEAVRIRMRGFYGIHADEVVIGTCARLEPIKNLGLLLDAFRLLLGNTQNVRLVIVGTGSEEEMLKGQAAEHGIADKVVFTGVTSNTNEIMNMFDIYALTSLDEGLPLSVLEAMATQCPVVATNVGSLAQVISPETGCLLNQPDPEMVCAALCELARNSEKRMSMGKRAREFVGKNYSSLAMVSAYMQVLQRSYGHHRNSEE